MKIKYYAAALSSFIVWGVFSLVLKPLSTFSSFDILTYRVACSAIVIALASLLFRRKVTKANFQYLFQLEKGKRNKFIIQAVGSAIALAMNWFLYIYVMNHVSVKATSLAYLICPILTTVLAALFLKEELNRGQKIAIGISVFACILLSYGHYIDVIYSIIIALSYAVYLVMQKANTQFDKFFTLTLHILIASILLVPYGLLSSTAVSFTNTFYSYILIIAVLFTIIPLFLNMYALKGLDSSVVGVLLYINPIIAFGLAVFYFGEPVNMLQGIGYSLILVAVILFNIAYVKRLKPA